MAYTSHGQHIPSTPELSTKPEKLCRGLWQCLPCMREAAKVINSNKKVQEHD